MNVLRDNRGEVKLGTVIWALLIGSSVYAGIMLVPMYYKHQMMIYEVEAEVKQAVRYDEDTTRRRLLEKATEWGLPITIEDIDIERNDYKIEITILYHIDKVFLTRFKHRFNFKLEGKGLVGKRVY